MMVARYERVVGLLSPDFLFTVGHYFSPFDASGMAVLNRDSFFLDEARFDMVKKSLGIGEWEKCGGDRQHL